MRHLALLAALGMMGSTPRRREDDSPPSPFKFKTLFIMRAPPGAGKSSVAASLVGGNSRNISKEVPSSDGPPETYRYGLCTHGVVCTTDAYFYDDWENDGEYQFNPRRIGQNHQLNQNAVSYAMSQGIPGIVVDNTNTKKWEMEAYHKLAAHYKYKVVVVEVPYTSVDACVERNSHGVPREVIENMCENLANERWPMDQGTDGDKVE